MLRRNEQSKILTTPKELQDRLKSYAIDIVRFAEGLPESPGFRTVRNQIVCCGPSSAANYRAACRGKLPADFKHKLEIVEEELDETMFWLEFTVGLDETKRTSVGPLWKEGNELLSIIIGSINATKRKLK
ncbi:four helix bundle protein [Fibrella sp. HMF5335]|uniref:Four helix bundle protein n=1 Tax=Fibrella rubiginis TaxID=2817060 RepID=A0A939K7M4_9BACT|nr:four helix bundle protein [Fibrella rubiginis]MBO0938770.1 four helix bundle protein [Fibrella rubiginis]